MNNTNDYTTHPALDFPVRHKSGIEGILEYTTPDGWAGVRGDFRRLDECSLEELEILTPPEMADGET